MSDNFLRLFLVVIVLGIVSAPIKIFNFDLSDLHKFPIDLENNWGDNIPNIFAIGSLGVFAAFTGLMAMLYVFLVAPVFQYGGNMIFLQAVRKKEPGFEYLINGFRENYLHIILANLLTLALIVLGFFALIIPGIIIACRLVFVSYIVMDKKVDPIEAVELSWKLTKGYGWKIFFMAIVSFFIALFGLILLIIGIFPAIIWISSSFASLYESVLKEKEKSAELIAG